MESYFYRKLIAFDFSRPAVLCSQLEHRGSVPRKDYPHMLVFADGTAVGTIGGGNIEHLVIEKAKKILTEQTTQFEKFDLFEDGTDASGSICGGTCHILMEPFTADVQKSLRAINLANLDEAGTILVTEVNTGEVTSAMRTAVTTTTELADFPDAVRDAASNVQRKGKSQTVRVGDSFYLIQRFAPTPRLHIFGAGHIGQAVAELASFIDLETIVYDDRTDLATADRFPRATKIYHDAYGDLPNRVRISPTDYTLIAARGHQHDLTLLRWLGTVNPAYVGLISSGHKWQILSKTLADDGVGQDFLKRVHAPVGLAIGSQTVPEIAISIMAQIVSVMRVADKSH